MQLKYNKGIIHSNRRVWKNIFEMKIEGDFSGNPGQFYMLRAWDREPFLSRPLSIFDVSLKYITFLYEVKGQGTEIFARLKSGDSIYLLGPLGNGFDIGKNINNKKIGIVAGGIGMAPMVYLAKKLKGNVDFYVGFRDEPYLMENIKDSVDNLYISTENGSFGHSGYIVEIFNPEKYYNIYSCGPIPMLRKVVSMCKGKNVPVYVSMESRMACGIGACLGCTIETVNGMKRVCKDGPVFSGEEVIWGD